MFPAVVIAEDTDNTYVWSLQFGSEERRVRKNRIGPQLRVGDWCVLGLNDSDSIDFIRQSNPLLETGFNDNGSLEVFCILFFRCILAISTNLWI